MSSYFEYQLTCAGTFINSRFTNYTYFKKLLRGSIKHMLASKPKKNFIRNTSCLILLESWLFLVSEYLCFVCLCPQIKKLWMFELMVSTFYQNET